MNYSVVIKNLRKKLFLSQKDIANILGVKYETINRWENHKFSPTIKLKKKINDFLFSKNLIIDDTNEIKVNKNIQINKDNYESNYECNYDYIANKSLNEIFSFYNDLNKETYHFKSTDDISTPMLCVKKMIDYVPSELWERKNHKILDPCCGNGNFGAYCLTKTNNDHIFYNELNEVRFKNCKKLLNPKNINCGDFFNLPKNFNLQYDLIMANPPYSGGGNKNQSLSNKFIFHSIDLLKNGGYLCFVTPNNWMTYNNNNETLHKLLNNGSFLVIDNDVKKYFTGVGSSFTVFVWQKGVFDNKTKVINNYLIKDIQENVSISKELKFIPLYISQTILDIILKMITDKVNKFTYRCDLHNFTRKDLLSDIKDNEFQYETIHTAKKTRYSKIKQDIFDQWLIIVPLSTYYIPYIKTKVNTTQSVGYFAFNKKNEAVNFLEIIIQPVYKLIVHLTRYGNFNNIMVMKHLRYGENVKLKMKEKKEIEKLTSLIKY
ncbi:methyltransferase [Ureaplasma canigenitalium]|uniref:methyltransferase n=1 Tax=Ureaplasma canigenitalium TaxID=42092 RepID=UPI0004E1916D|nr:methyltransferase [Ureaplasma canigenitalium]